MWGLDWRYCLRLLLQALPLAIAYLFGVVYFRLDALMLSKMIDDSAAGIYGAAYKFIESSSMISGILLSSLFPVFSFFFEHDRAKFAQYYNHAIDIVLSLACLIAVFVYINADILVLSLNGQAF